MNLDVLIMSPVKTIFKGPAVSVTCKSPKGEFDVLPRHSFFMSMIDSYIYVRTPDHHKKTIYINQAILQVSHDTVVILINVQEKEARTLIQNILRPEEIMHPQAPSKQPIENKKKV